MLYGWFYRNDQSKETTSLSDFYLIIYFILGDKGYHCVCAVKSDIGLQIQFAFLIGLSFGLFALLIT